MRPRDAWRRLPRPLLALLVSIAVLGVGWSLLTPPWQSPDENAHFGYAQTLAENQRLPSSKPGPVFSTEQTRASLAVNANQVASNLLAKPVWSTRLYDRWAAGPEGSRSDGGYQPPGGSANPARANPPVYYAWEAIPYYAASGGDVFSRLYLMRIWSVMFALVSAAATWLLVGELAGRGRPLLQLAGAAVAGLEPMALFLSSSVTPDGLLNAALAVMLWLGVVVLKRGFTPARGTALCAALAAAILAKATAYALVPAAAFALGLAIWRLPGTRARAVAALTGAAVVVPVGLWVGLTRLAGRPAVNQIGGGGGTLPKVPGPFSYLWQYYLPKLPGQMPLPSGYPKLPAIDIWLKGGWARFGWLEVVFPGVVYTILGVASVLVLAGAGAVVLRRGLRADAAVLAFFGIAVLGLFGGLHVTEYRALHNTGTSLNQGRYLLPLLPIFGACAAASLTLLRPRARAIAAGALLGGMLVLQLASLALVAGRFYA